MSASLFFGARQAVQLLRQDGTLVSAAEALRDKRYVLVYFSAHWCPPCRAFTPQLKHFYERHHESKNFEVVFISLDNSEAEMKAYFREAHGNWLCMPHAEARGLGQSWMSSYGCRFIPTLLVFEQPGVGQPAKTVDGDSASEKAPATDPVAQKDGGSRVLVTFAGRDMLPRDPNAESFPWVNADAEVANRNAQMKRVGGVALACAALFVMWMIMG